MKTSVRLVILLLGLMATAAMGKRKSRTSQESGVADEYKLMRYLMEKIARVNPTGAVRPVLNINETLHVSFGLALISINNIDRVSGMAEFKVFDRLAWRDSLLAWNPDDFGGISVIRVPMGKPMWKPDLKLYNSVNDQEPYNEDTLGVLSSDGSMLYIPPTVKKVKCAIQPGGMFHKDVAHCTFKFGSWTYDGFKLDVKLYYDLESIDLTDVIPDSRYEILSSTAQRIVKYYPCCVEPYPNLTFNLTVRFQ